MVPLGTRVRTIWYTVYYMVLWYTMYVHRVQRTWDHTMVRTYVLEYPIAPAGSMGRTYVHVYVRVRYTCTRVRTYVQWYTMDAYVRTYYTCKYLSLPSQPEDTTSQPCT